MDCIIDYQSFVSMKESYDHLLANVQHLETENDVLEKSNRLLKRLMSTLECIKLALEQKMTIIDTAAKVSTVADQLVPFERELQRLDADYCHLKYLLNKVEFDEDDEDEEDEDNEANNDCEENNNNGVVGGGSAHDMQTDELMSTTTTTSTGANCAIAELTTHNTIDDNSLVDATTSQTSIVATDVLAAVTLDDNHSIISTGQTLTTDDGVQHVFHQLPDGQVVITTTTTRAATDGDLNASVYTTHVMNATDSAAVSSVKKSRNRRKADLTATPGLKRFRCDWEGCVYSTDSSGNYQKHYRIHTGEKPFKCDFNGCEYSCSDPGSIKEHRRIHSADKQFACDWPDCQWRFNTYKLLKNHRRACHTGEKPHKCDWPGCDKSFLAPYALRTHKLKHTGIRPHKCDIEDCVATFTRPTDLARHKRETHCSERSYVCEHENCESKFFRKDDLRHHIRRKHEFPQLGRRAKRQNRSTGGGSVGRSDGSDVGLVNNDSMTTTLSAKRNTRRKLTLKTDSNIPTGADNHGLDVSGGNAVVVDVDNIDEPKVVIDMIAVKGRKPIQIKIN
ncbi:zinc finger protein 143-like [Oppia nitens]|uniref:zinc finger protein 143-like n=1 Tax=Oppia nitens TaxID=1686743 RepID=UPI0023DB2340|nr:zinc finger protein 143-like [Oppia nitens]